MLALRATPSLRKHLVFRRSVRCTCGHVLAHVCRLVFTRLGVNMSGQGCADIAFSFKNKKGSRLALDACAGMCHRCSRARTHARMHARTHALARSLARTLARSLARSRARTDSRSPARTHARLHARTHAGERTQDLQCSHTYHDRGQVGRPCFDTCLDM